MSNPRLFISYSWSTPEHEQWVVDLATQLQESGIEVIFDKWDLKEGHDSISFMEKMVTDPTITKVAVVSDKTYAEKADGRAGGVGTETTIISREVYEKTDQGKFVAVLPSKDDHGKPYLPTYYKGRIYIDLSESDRYAENFEKLLRWAYDKPLHVKPELGSKPAFLTDGPHVSLGTTALFNRCVDSIKNNRPYAPGALDEYLNTFAENLERFRLTRSDDKEWDDAVVESMDEFLPYRNEFIQLLIVIAQYAATSENAQKLHRFFERLIPYMHRPMNVNQWNDFDFDNFKFIIHEMFLYAIAIFIKHEKFDVANELITLPYFIAISSDHGQDAIKSFRAMREYMPSMDMRNKRLDFRRLSLRADLLEKRSKSSGIEFRQLMQADFVLFLRAGMENDEYRTWWPETLLYAAHSYGPFEIFARSASKTYFNRAKVLLGIETPKDLEEQLTRYATTKRELPRWDFDTFNPTVLLGYDKLASRA